jgi:thiamine-phosphate pyrophosphorylase
MQLVRENSRINREGERRTRLLVNSRSDVAIAVGADGVHLRSEDISPSTARSLWEKSSGQQNQETFPLIAVSCHTEVEVARAAADGADFAVFAPVFEKRGLEINAAGLETLRLACRYDIPVLALGGVTLENIPACLNAGAAGVAGIRLFQENDIGAVVGRLRGDQG